MSAVLSGYSPGAKIAMTPILTVFIPGVPRAGGSKRAFPFRKADGSLGVRVTDANDYVMLWRSVVSYFGKRAMAGREPFTDALAIEVVFALPRPKAHFNKAGVLTEKHTLTFATKKPDCTKLLRAFEDALIGIIWHDDSQIVAQTVRKIYATASGAHLRVRYADPIHDLFSLD